MNGNVNKNDAIVTETGSTSADIILCPKCGAEMKKTARYCMKCGQLNYAHPDNASMKEVAWKGARKASFVMGDNYNSFNISGNHIGIFRDCLIINIILHLILVVLLALPMFLFGKGAVAIVLIVLIVGIMFFYNYAFQRIYIKAGENWWAYFVPLYGQYVQYKISLGNGWLFLLSFIPVINVILMLISNYKLGKNFNKSGVLTLLFSPVMIPIIAYGKSEFGGFSTKKVNLESLSNDPSKKTDLEKRYGVKKFIVTTILLIVLAFLAYFSWDTIKPVLIKLYDIVVDFYSNIVGQ